MSTEWHERVGVILGTCASVGYGYGLQIIDDMIVIVLRFLEKQPNLQ